MSIEMFGKGSGIGGVSWTSLHLPSTGSFYLDICDYVPRDDQFQGQLFAVGMVKFSEYPHFWPGDSAWFHDIDAVLMKQLQKEILPSC